MKLEKAAKGCQETVLSKDTLWLCGLTGSMRNQESVSVPPPIPPSATGKVSLLKGGTNSVELLLHYLKEKNKAI